MSARARRAGSPTICPKGGKLGYDPWLHTANGIAALKSAAARAGGTLVPCEANPLDTIWTDRPPPPAAPATPHAFNLAGETSQSKRARLAERLGKAGVKAAVLTLANSVCWLLNIRGADVPHTPFVLAFAILRDDGSADLFLDPAKSSKALADHLGPGVRIRAAGEFAAALDALKGARVLADPATAAAAIFDRLEAAGAEVSGAPILPAAQGWQEPGRDRGRARRPARTELNQ